MAIFVHVGTFSDVLADIRDWLDSGRELLVDLIAYVEDEGEDDEGEDDEDEGEDDEGDEDADEGDYEDEGGYHDGYDDAITQIIGAVEDYAKDNPMATVADMIIFLKGEFR